MIYFTDSEWETCHHASEETSTLLNIFSNPHFPAQMRHISTCWIQDLYAVSSTIRVAQQYTYAYTNDLTLVCYFLLKIRHSPQSFLWPSLTCLHALTMDIVHHCESVSCVSKLPIEIWREILRFAIGSPHFTDDQSTSFSVEGLSGPSSIAFGWRYRLPLGDLHIDAHKRKQSVASVCRMFHTFSQEFLYETLHIRT